MINAIKQFFNQSLSLNEGETNNEHVVQRAAAALLIELSYADFELHSDEQKTIETALIKRFGLEQAELDTLIELAKSEKDKATSLYEFTRLINDNYSPEQKFELLTSLWEVAFADGEISKYEDNLIRKIADLIYAPHSDFIKAKLKVISDK